MTFDFVWKSLRAAIEWAVDGLINFFKDHFKLFWAIIAILIALVTNIFDVMIIMINWIVEMLQSVNTGSFNFGVGFGISQFLSIANTFFPVDEFCRFYVAWMTLYLIMTAIRWIKSFLPTVAGTGINGD